MCWLIYPSQGQPEVSAIIIVFHRRGERDQCFSNLLKETLLVSGGAEILTPRDSRSARSASRNDLCDAPSQWPVRTPGCRRAD